MEVHYSLGNLIGDIGRGRIELHDNKRPFFLVQRQALCTRNDLAVAAARDGSTLGK